MKHKKEIAHYDEMLKRTSGIEHERSREELNKTFKSQRDSVAQRIGKCRGGK
jgi:hypothetical protein